MKHIGIWMDRKKAHIVRLAEDGETMETLVSGLEFYHPRGGSRTRSAKWGPQDVVQDSKYLEREKHQLHAYFMKVLEAVKDADAIVLFGPADTARRFKDEIRANHSGLAEKFGAVIKADSMTENQTRAMIREYFER